MGVMLEIAIGVSFMFLLLSLVCTAAGEAIEHLHKYRAHYLKLGIEKLLLAGDTTLRDNLFKHALIQSLYTPSRFSERIRTTGPSYIPSRKFALALLEVVAQGKTPGPKDGEDAQDPAYSPPRSVAEVLLRLEDDGKKPEHERLPAHLVGALKTLAADAGDDFEKFKAGIEQWFDESMNRVTGWYKRRAQLVAFAIGLVVAVALNADTIVVVRTLAADSTVRAALVASAEQYVADNPAPPAGAGTPASEDRPGTDEASRGAETGATGVDAGGGVAEEASGGAAATPPEGSDPFGNVSERMQKAIDELGGLGLPIGWRTVPDAPEEQASAGAAAQAASIDRVRMRVWPGWRWSGSGHWYDQISAHLLGWLLTAVGLSLGAPFWFDLLGKFMSIRTSPRPIARPAHHTGQAEATPRTQTVRVEVAPAALGPAVVP